MINYTFYDECNKLIAIVTEDTTLEEVEKLKKEIDPITGKLKYYDVKYKEEY